MRPVREHMRPPVDEAYWEKYHTSYMKKEWRDKWTELRKNHPDLDNEIRSHWLTIIAIENRYRNESGWFPRSAVDNLYEFYDSWFMELIRRKENKDATRDY